MRQNFSLQVDQTFFLIISIAVVLLLIVTIAMIYFVFRYSKKRNPVATDITGNTKLEIMWTLIPTVLVLIMFWSSYSGFKLMRNAPSDAMVINVTGQMWKWTFEYENGKKSDTLYVPLGKAIKMVIRSIDVNHSFFLPHYRVKEDAIPGRTNYLWFDAVELGSWDIACAEYCGLSHSYMYTKVKVVPENEFNIWYNVKDSLSAVKDTIVKDSTKK